MSLQLENERKEASSFRTPASGSAPASGGGRARWLLIGLAALVVAALIGLAYWRRGANAPEATAPAAANTTGTVKFLMEQQWRVHTMIAQSSAVGDRHGNLAVRV